MRRFHLSAIKDFSKCGKEKKINKVNGINGWMAAADVKGERAWKRETVFVEAIIGIAIAITIDFECNMNHEKVLSLYNGHGCSHPYTAEDRLLDADKPDQPK